MKVLTSLRDALNDPRLLGKALQGDSWHVWRTLLIAAMGEPLTKGELETFRAVTGRDESPTRRCEELIGIVGRRGGKSRAIAVLATYLSNLIDYRDVLAPGERGLLLCVAPDIKQASIVHGYIAGCLAGSEVLKPLLDSSTRNVLRLTNGLDIETRSASFRRLRGVTCIAAIADESCFWYSEEVSANPDSEILSAIRPALATTSGLLAIISTPYARKGATWEAFSRDYGPNGDPAVLVATGSSRTFNPSLSQRVIDRAYERDPIAAAAEYGGQWRSDIAAFLSRDAVLACVDHGCQERVFWGGLKYNAFVDPSGGSNDSFAMAISHLDGQRVVIDVLREARPPFSPASVVGEFCETLKAFKVCRVTGDRYAGEWPREAFARHGIKYDTSDRTASQLFLELLPLINAGVIALLDHRRLLDQLINLERRTGFGTGKDTVGHPPHCHDDLAVALAGAALLATTKPRDLRTGYGAPGISKRIVWREEREHSRLFIDDHEVPPQRWSYS